MPDFEPISLLEPDTERTHKSDSPGNGYDVSIRLSAAAPDTWKRHFHEKWTSDLGSDYRRTRVEGDYIVLENCPIEEASIHEDRLRATVDHANRLYAADLARIEKQQRNDQLADEAEREHIRSLSERLKFR